MKKKAIVAGHICIDITPVFHEGRVRKMTDVLVPGKLINTRHALVNTGGAVANTGLAMKIFGADVRLMGKIGTDEIGGMIRNVLKKYDADGDVVLAEGAGSSYTIVIAPPGIDRMFLHYPGPNDTFGADDVSDEALDQAELFHLGYPPLMRRMYQNDGEELVRLFRRVKERGLVTSLDFAGVDPHSEAAEADWAAIVKNVIPYVDFFVPSIEELGYMIAPKLHEEWIAKADGKSVEEIITLEHDVRPLADQLFEWGARTVMIKCGAPGIYYRSAGEAQMSRICEKLELRMEEWSGIEGFEPSFEPECVRSGTGAGDTSIGAFLTSALEGYGLRKAVQMAAAAGASCVEAYDALGGLSSFEKLQERIAGGWKKVK